MDKLHEVTFTERNGNTKMNLKYQEMRNIIHGQPKSSMPKSQISNLHIPVPLFLKQPLSDLRCKSHLPNFNAEYLTT